MYGSVLKLITMRFLKSTHKMSGSSDALLILNSFHFSHSKTRKFIVQYIYMKIYYEPARHQYIEQENEREYIQIRLQCFLPGFLFIKTHALTSRKVINYIMVCVNVHLINVYENNILSESMKTKNITEMGSCTRYISCTSYMQHPFKEAKLQLTDNNYFHWSVLEVTTTKKIVRMQKVNRPYTIVKKFHYFTVATRFYFFSSIEKNDIFASCKYRFYLSVGIRCFDY